MGNDTHFSYFGTEKVERTMEEHSTVKPVEPPTMLDTTIQYQGTVECGSVALNDSLNFDKKRFKIKNKIIIEPDMFYSGSFKRLSASAIRTLMRCLQKRKWNKVKSNGKKKIVYENDGFIFPYVEAKFLGIGTTQHSKNVKALVEVGFLDIVHQGGWYQKNERTRDYSVYKLSDRWKLYDTKYFVKVEKPKVLNPEFYIRKNIEKQKARATSQKRSGHLHRSEVDGTKQGNNRLHKSEVGRIPEEPAARPDNTI